ncbi:MAG: glycosyltransferase family 4 protein [Fimbriimonadaceae bacterium]|nr:glycosyltransferase family 4 protein [Fimbriimonadaceae bacterium]
MKLLLLKRQTLGGIHSHATSLAEELRRQGHEVHLEEATDWIPNETGRKPDKAVSERLKALAEPYDLVHAFGYRAAWACSAAFAHKEAWLYTAYDLPKTTHRQLISRLNDSQAGICSSRAVFRVLDEAIAIDLTTIRPGIAVPIESPADKTTSKKAFDIEADTPVIGVATRHILDCGLSSVIAAMEEVWATKPDTTLLIAGDGPERENFEREAKITTRNQQIRFLGVIDDPATLYRASDVVIAASLKAGFSMSALEAMSLGVPVLARNRQGLIELFDREISGFYFESDDELSRTIVDLLEMPLTLESVGRAGRIRAMDRYSLEQCANQVVELYRTILRVNSE